MAELRRSLVRLLDERMAFPFQWDGKNEQRIRDGNGKVRRGSGRPQKPATCPPPSPVLVIFGLLPGHLQSNPRRMARTAVAAELDLSGQGRVFQATMAFENEAGQWYIHAGNRPSL